MITSTYENHVKEHPEKIAVYTKDEKVNFREWDQLVAKTANWLSEKVGIGGKVGILLPNGIPFLQVFTGTAAAGLIAVPFDLKWKKAEFRQRYELAQPAIFITTKRIARRLQLSNGEVVLWEDIEEELLKANRTFNKQFTDDTFFYMGFTSGTTGSAKGFVRSHQSWVHSFSSSHQDFGLHESDEVLIPGSLVHSHFLYGAICALYFGGTVYLLDAFSPTKTLEWLEKFPITAIYVVPTMIEAMSAAGGCIKRPVTILSSGAKWDEHSKRNIYLQFPNVTMYEFYGASETSLITYLNDAWNKERPESVGKACTSVELQVRNSDGHVVEPGVIGKIYVKSPLVFSGYIQPGNGALWTIEDEDGWMTVDDIGYINHEGFLYIKGREKSMIICGGENVYPEEIEAVLLKHPDVEEAAVIGIEDAYWGEIPVAFIRGDVSVNELQRLCREQLSAFKYPRQWHILEAFPYTTSGKIARHQLEEYLLTEVLEN